MNDSLTGDWTGGVSDFATDPGAVSDFPAQQPAPSGWWDALLAQFGDMFGVPALISAVVRPRPH